MKKKSTILLLVLCCFVFNEAVSQVIRHSENSSKVDSAALKGGFESNSLILEDAMQEIEIDTNESYGQEFLRDKFRFQWGLRGGIARSQLNFTNIVPIRITSSGSPAIVNGRLVRDTFRSNSKFAQQFSGGVFGRVSRGSFFVQPELVYTQKGGIFDIVGRDNRLVSRVDAAINVIDFPVLMGIKFRKARIFFGPVTSFAFCISEDFQNGLKPYATVPLDGSLLQRPTLNFMSGIGFEFNQFFFDVRYESGLSNYTDVNIGPSSNPARFRFSSNVIMFSIGIIQ